MNTGLHDVWNLRWKLDLFLNGHGNERLLDSYSAERLPIIKDVIEATDFLTKVMGTPNKFAQALRECRHTHGVASRAISACLRAEAL
jgi:4,5-epoxidase